MEGFKMTEEKVRKLLPIVESILCKKYGRKITLKDLTIGGITVHKEKTVDTKVKSLPFD